MAVSPGAILGDAVKLTITFKNRPAATGGIHINDNRVFGVFMPWSFQGVGIAKIEIVEIIPVRIGIGNPKKSVMFEKNTISRRRIR